MNIPLLAALLALSLASAYAAPRLADEQQTLKLIMVKASYCRSVVAVEKRATRSSEKSCPFIGIAA